MIRDTSVTIECLAYGDFITRYDRLTTLFYLDPPYWGCETDYGKDMFGREDFENLAKLLKSIKGRFLLSLNDVEGVRETFREFQIEAVKTTYSIAKNSSKRVGEVIISNV